MKILGTIIAVFLILVVGYFLVSIGTILKNGTSLTQAPGTVTRLKLFLSKNSAETAENSPFPELLPQHFTWNTAELGQFNQKIVETAESLGYQIQDNNETLEHTSEYEQLLHFTITTKTFKFIDDLYIGINIDDENGFVVNAKSSSRTGRADFGANIANIRNFFDRLKQTF